MIEKKEKTKITVNNGNRTRTIASITSVTLAKLIVRAASLGTCASYCLWAPINTKRNSFHSLPGDVYNRLVTTVSQKINMALHSSTWPRDNF